MLAWLQHQFFSLFDHPVNLLSLDLLLLNFHFTFIQGRLGSSLSRALATLRFLLLRQLDFSLLLDLLVLRRFQSLFRDVIEEILEFRPIPTPTTSLLRLDLMNMLVPNFLRSSHLRFRSRLT